MLPAMRMRASTLPRLLLCAGLVIAVAGCAADPVGPAPEVVVEPGAYAATFNAAREVLRDRGFILERVDAHAGVITTRPKTTAGLATPWDTEQQTFTQEVEDLLERQQRIVRVTFEPRGGDAAAAPADAASGQATSWGTEAGDGVRVMRVLVTLEREQIPGRRLEPEAIGMSSFTWDVELGARQMQPRYAVAIRDDRRLADALVREIERASLRRDVDARPASDPRPSAPSMPPSEPEPEPLPLERQWVPGQPVQEG